MIRFLLITFAAFSGAWALAPGELSFTLGGKSYTTQNARAVIQTKGGKTRVMVAVKDISQRFMLVLTADLAPGDEGKPLQLTTDTAALGVTLRTAQGSLAVLPRLQLAKITDTTYSERVEVDTGELEDEPGQQADHHKDGHHKRKRRKIRTEYRRVKPRWHTMSRAERLSTGEGVIENAAFRDTFFSLRLIPVKVGEKVVSYEGSFAGVGRFSQSISGAESKPLQNGVFNVQVEYAQ